MHMRENYQDIQVIGLVSGASGIRGFRYKLIFSPFNAYLENLHTQAFPHDSLQRSSPLTLQEYFSVLLLFFSNYLFFQDSFQHFLQ